MVRVRQIMPAIAIPLLLGGCGLPPIYSVAKSAVDGVMWLATGKTSTDHGLSLVLRQDCMLFRVIEGSDVCRLEITEAQAYNASRVPSVAPPVAVAKPAVPAITTERPRG